MSRATVVYLGMVGVFVAGLWAVLAVGGHLHAPEDLAGRWTSATPGRGWPAVTVAQSGRYFELSFEGGPTVAASVTDRSPDGGLSLARGPWRVAVGPAQEDGVRTFRVDGPTAGTFAGRRAVPATGPAQ